MAPALALLVLGTVRVLLGFLEASISPLVYIMLLADARVTRAMLYITLLDYMVKLAMASPVSLSSRLASPSASLSASLSPSSISPSSAPVESPTGYVVGFIIIAVIYCSVVFMFCSGICNCAKRVRQRTNWPPRQEREPTSPHLVDRLRRVSAVPAAQTLQGPMHNAETEYIELDRLSRVPTLTVEAAEELMVTSPITGDGVQFQEHEEGSAEEQEHAQPAIQGEQAPPADRTSVTTVIQILDSSRTTLGVSSPAATTSDDVLRSVNALGYEPISDEQRGKDREAALKQLEGH